MNGRLGPLLFWFLAHASPQPEGDDISETPKLEEQINPVSARSLLPSQPAAAVTALGAVPSAKDPLNVPPTAQPPPARVAAPYSQLLQEAQVPECAGLQLADVVHAQVSGREERQRALISLTVVCME